MLDIPNKINFPKMIFVLAIVISSSLIFSIGDPSKTIRIVDINSHTDFSVFQDSTYEMDIGRIDLMSYGSKNNFMISPDIGEDFSDPIVLNFVTIGQVQIAESNQSLTESQPFLYFVFDADQATPVFISLNLLPLDNRPDGVDIDFELYNQFFEPIAYAGEPAEFDEFVEFVAPDTGQFFIKAFIFDTNLASSDFQLQVVKEQAGTVQQGKSTYIQSKGHERIINILNYFIDEGFVNGIDNSVDIVSLIDDKYNYGKGLGISIFGILRAGDSAAARILANETLGPAAFALAEAELAPYLGVAENLLVELNKTRVTVGAFAGLYTIPNTSGGEFNTTLTANIYALLAMIDYWQFISGAYNSNPDFAEADTLLTKIDQTLVAIYNVFFDPTDKLFYEAAVHNSGTGLIDSVNTRYYLESNALLLQFLNTYRILAGGVPSTPFLTTVGGDLDAFTTDLFNAIIAFFMQPVTGATAPGLGVEWHDQSDDSNSTAVTLMGNSFLLDILTPQIDNAHIFNLTPTFLNRASVLAENILAVFRESNGLLVDRVQTDGTKGTTSSIYAHNFILNALYRLGARWKELDDTFNFADYGGAEISRTWSRAALSLLDKVENTMVDDRYDTFFAEYKHNTQTIHNDQTILETNTFVSNAAMLDFLSSTFTFFVQLEAPKYVEVESPSVAVARMTQAPLIGSFIYFQFIPKLTIDTTFTSPEIGLSETQTIDLITFDFDTGFVPYEFQPTKRGKITMVLDVKQEGFTALAGSIEVTALGNLYPEFTHSDFEIYSDDTSFTAKLSIINEEGKAAANLEVESTLFIPPDIIGYNEVLRNRYLTTDRTDASGAVDLSFAITNMINDFSLFEDGERYIRVPIFINVTNGLSYNYRTSHPFVIELGIELAEMTAIISPSFLDIVQGTDNDYSFSISVVNQKLAAVSLATVAYELNGKTNSITTDTDGSGTITLKSNDITALQPPEVELNITLTHSSYPQRTFIREIHIVPNEIVIIANPVQVEAKSKTFFETKAKAVSLEVATEDRFGDSVNANISLSWLQGEEGNFDLRSLGSHLSPYTFELDPSDIDEGEYTVLITANRFGLSPSVTERRIIITAPSIYESAVSAFLIYGAWILTKVLQKVFHLLLIVMGVLRTCPHCGERTGKRPACISCGNLIKDEKSGGVSSQPNSGEISPDIGGIDEHPEK